jgi:hypothetical protein
MVMSYCDISKSYECLECVKTESIYRECYCGKMSIWTQNASKNNQKILIKISENIFNKAINEIKCEYKCNDHIKYEFVGSILISSYLYIFVQFYNNKKNNILCVIQGQVDLKYCVIDETVTVKMCYNMYNLFKNENIDKKCVKDSKIVEVTYSYCDDIFLLLINCDNKTILGKIEHLEAFHSIGTHISIIYQSPCNYFLINNPPICIKVIDKKKYKLYAYDKCGPCDGNVIYYILNFS